VASLSELAPKYRRLLTAYRWRTLTPSPWTALSKPLPEARIAIVTSAGLYHPGSDVPFRKQRGGDPSVRWLGSEMPITSFVLGQTSDAFDRRAIEADPNEAFPLDRLRELVARRELGSVARAHPSFNGSMTAPGRFVADTAPAVATVLVKDRVDAALLVPV
jgi:hypothetical protein